VLVTGTVPLTEALTERLGQGKPDALEPAQVIPYLTKEMGAFKRFVLSIFFEDLYPEYHPSG
jgi:hypothetical protein